MTDNFIRNKSPTNPSKYKIFVMRRFYIVGILLIFNLTAALAQEVEVLSLGTFHFAFYNKDVVKIDKENQIDVLDDQYQSEIEDIVRKISDFKPTHIAIEVDPGKQSKIDSMYNEYLNGNYQLRRNETEQLGIRLAKQFGLKKLFCVNAWGQYPQNIEQVLDGTDSIVNQEFMEYFSNNPDSLIYYNKEDVFKSQGILEELRQLNTEENLKKDLGNYLISVFKYQTEDNEFFGVDFTSIWWFNRNLRIFRNIQKINTQPGDKILVIFGAGHMNILNPLFDVSPEYKLVKTNDYLK